MATGDQLVLTPQATGPLNAAYATAGAQSLQMIAATATFDGSVAAGAFKPALAFYDAGGALLSRAVAADTVAAGDTAEVSFFPFVPQSSTSASCGGIIDSTATAGGTCGVHSVGASSGDVLESDGLGGSAWATPTGGGYAPSPATGVYNVAAVNITAGGSSTASLVFVRGTAVLDLSAPANPKVTTQGVYYILGNFQGNAVFSAGTSLAALLFVNSSPTVDSYLGVPNLKSTIGPLGHVDVMVPCAANTNFSLTLTNWDSSTRACEWPEIVVTRALVY